MEKGGELMTISAPAKFVEFEVPDPEAANYLSAIFGIKDRNIRAAMYQTHFYAERIIPKHSGKARIIFIPRPGLKFVQHLLDERLRGMFEALNYEGMFGTAKATSYIKHAQYHSDAKYVLQMDLQDAYSSVKKTRLKTTLRRLLTKKKDSLAERYERHYRFFGDKNKTKINKEWTAQNKKELVNKLTDIIIELCTRRDILPQGTPTAPFLFHLYVAVNLFPRLQKICGTLPPAYHAKLSMYIDNIVISSAKPIPQATIADIRTAIVKAGLKDNERKTKQALIRNTCPLITGLRINNGKAVLSRRWIRFLRGYFNRAADDKSMWIQAFGYHTMIKHIYRYPGPEEMPRQLRKAIDKFEKAVAGQRWDDFLQGKGHYARLLVRKSRYALED
jgi:hypothetical protein